MPLAVEATTLDDLLHNAYEYLRDHGVEPPEVPSRGATLETLGARLELRDPRARLSRTESRRRTTSAVGELAWYLSGSDDASHISYWINAYRDEAESDGRIHGAYGPRMFGEAEDAQFSRALTSIRQNPATRRAVIQIFDREDTAGERKRDIPCTCTIQLLQRAGRLHMVVSMRSNDAILGLPHDIFAFTMLQEIAATELCLELGTYIHQVASFHIYKSDVYRIDEFLGEGWQSSLPSMPEMPHGPQADSIRSFLEAETQIRSGVNYDRLTLPSEPYWADLVRLLAWGSARRRKDRPEIARVADDFASPSFSEFVR